MKQSESRLVLNEEANFNKMDTSIKVKQTEIDDLKTVIRRLENDISEQNKIAYEMEMCLKNERDNFENTSNNMKHELSLQEL